MLVSVVIAIMIAIVVGVNMLPLVIGEEVAEAVEEVPPEGALAVVINVLPYIVIAVVILGVVAWMGGMGDGSFIRRWISEWTASRPNSKSLEREFASRSWDFKTDRKNLDRLLGVQIEPVAGTEEEPLRLRETVLFLSKESIWYLDGKSSRGILYKIVGLNQRHRNLNSVFILGRDAHTTIPFLLRLPPNFLRESLEDCLRWCIQSGKGDIIREV